MNFTIQYPSNWEAEIDEVDEILREYDSSVKNIIFEVDFLLNEKDRPSLPTDDIPFTGFFTVRVEKIESYLDTDTMTLQNKSIQQYAQEFIYNYLEPGDVIRQSKVTVGGNDGLKLEYYQIGYNSDIFTIANGKLYALKYMEVPLKVPETLPLANKMVQSFQIKTE